VFKYTGRRSVTAEAVDTTYQLRASAKTEIDVVAAP
jgi:hypothetical protein